MIIKCKNCGHLVNTDTDKVCNGCGEGGLVVLFSKEALEPAEDLKISNEGLNL